MCSSFFEFVIIAMLLSNLNAVDMNTNNFATNYVLWESAAVDLSHADSGCSIIVIAFLVNILKTQGVRGHSYLTFASFLLPLISSPAL